MLSLGFFLQDPCIHVRSKDALRFRYTLRKELFFLHGQLESFGAQEKHVQFQQNSKFFNHAELHRSIEAAPKLTLPV